MLLTKKNDILYALDILILCCISWSDQFIFENIMVNIPIGEAVLA